MTLIFETMLAVVSAVLLLWAIASTPVAVRCPSGWWLPFGVRTDGIVRCTDQRIELEIDSRIYCTGGSHPVVGNDGLTVGCSHVQR